jgi:predicted lipoprotein with Yx(FWY)xxD motif
VSQRKLATVLAALGTTVTIAACSSPSGQGAPVLSNVAAAVPAPDPAVDPLADPAADPSLTDPALTPATDDGYASAPTRTPGSDGDGSADRGSAPRTSAPRETKVVRARVANRLVATQAPQVGGVVTDQKGWILYRFDKDSPNPPTSNCNGACAKTWPPVLVEGTPDLKGVSADKVGTVERADGTTQVTLGGWPLYYYSKDAKPGDWKGQGVGGTWFVVAKDGKKNTNRVQNMVAAASASAAGPAVEGRVATDLVAMAHPKLGSVVTDQKGSVLYRFDKDSPNPPTSNCNGACARTWPPVLVNTDIRLQGISPDRVGKIKRADGSWQITLAGWPLYSYSKDAKPGDWKGQGVGGTWFVVTKDGKRNLNCVPATARLAARTTPPVTAGYAYGGY